MSNESDEGQRPITRLGAKKKGMVIPSPAIFNVRHPKKASIADVSSKKEQTAVIA
jgi:hypothetical protein